MGRVLARGARLPQPRVRSGEQGVAGGKAVRGERSLGGRRALSRLGTHPGRPDRSRGPRASGAWPGPPRGRRPLPRPTAESPPGHPSSRVCGSVDGRADVPKGRPADGVGIGQSCCCPPRLASPRSPQPRPGDAPREGTSPFGSVGVSLSRPVCPKPALSPGARFCSVVYLVFCHVNTVCHSRAGMFLWRH